jgi:hypothetical protein
VADTPGRAAGAGRLGYGDRLAATLAHWWADPTPEDAALAAFAETGAIDDSTVAALRSDLDRLRVAAEGPVRIGRYGGERTVQTIVEYLLVYAEQHTPREAVPGWIDLREPRTAVELFAAPGWILPASTPAS